jgi:antitoxin (DNA-binding transcriptional repressor) of toxin-antitoxin stability system
MQTLTVTKARANLGHWVRRALNGEDIGVVMGSKLVALRPVPIEAGDYMEREYGLTTAEADRAAAAIARESDRARMAGEYVNLDKVLRKNAPARTPVKAGRGKTRRASRR